MGKQRKEVKSPKTRKSQNKTSEQVKKNFEVLKKFNA